MRTRALFKNSYDELRAGWQIAIFLLLFSALIAPMLVALRPKDTLVVSVISLAGLLIATLIAARFLNRKPLHAVGLAVNKHTMRDLGIGCLAGWLMMTGIFGIEYALGYVKVVAPEISLAAGLSMTMLSLIFFGVAAMVEELLFRGYPFQILVRGINFIPAVGVMGILFGLAHLRNPNATAMGVLNTILVAVLFCYAYWRTRGLWLPFGIHFAWNFSQTTLYGYPTSGMHFSSYELTRLTQFGPEWMTGGAYGPEAGALATLMILLCGLYVHYSRRLQPFPGVVTLEREEERRFFQLYERRDAA
jgi:hypothetical protein